MQVCLSTDLKLQKREVAAHEEVCEHAGNVLKFGSCLAGVGIVASALTW